MKAVVLAIFCAASAGLVSATTRTFNADAARVCDVSGNSSTCGTVKTTAFSRGYLIEAYTPGTSVCKAQLLLPIFPGETMWSTPLRTIFYLVGLLYTFLGVAIIADMFMASIEVITSKRKAIPIFIDSGDGEKHVVYRKVLVWNETVSNLTLMALGSSAPEILLAVIETVSQLGKDPSGGLGAGTIVGSAAFNLLCITGICILAIPDGEGRKVKQLGVFAVTATFSLLAYVWLLVVLQFVSPDEVELWEAIVTFICFPLLVVLAFGQDVQWPCCRSSRSKRTIRPVGEVPQGLRLSQRGHSLKLSPRNGAPTIGAVGADRNSNRESALMDARDGALDHVDTATIAALITDESVPEHLRARLRDGPIDDHLMNEVANALTEVMDAAPHSRMRYRIDGVRGLTGGKRVVLDRHARRSVAASSRDAGGEAVKPDSSVGMVKGKLRNVGAEIKWSSPMLRVRESAGHVELRLVRSGKMEEACSVMVQTVSDTAVGGEDFTEINEKVVFEAGQTSAVVRVPIVDDDEYEGAEQFFVLIYKPSGCFIKGSSQAVVTIIDDDHPGVFGFSEAQYFTNETMGQMQVTVTRRIGAQGTVDIEYSTIDGTAVAGADYSPCTGTLRFLSGETEKTISIPITQDDRLERDETFEMDLSNPVFYPPGAVPPVLLSVSSSTASPVKANRAAAPSPVKPSKGGTEAAPLSMEGQQETKADATEDMATEDMDDDEVPLERRASAEAIQKAITLTAKVGHGRVEDDGAIHDLPLLDERHQCLVTITTDKDTAQALNVLAARLNTQLGKMSLVKVSWGAQFKEALLPGGGEEMEMLSTQDYVMHALTLPWKLIFAFVPPTSYMGGWLAFGVALTFIGGVTAIVGDLASIFGCLIGLPDGITAITFVALGTSLPDTFASKTAAVQDDYADASIGNVTGSNSVNVFLGLGLPWVIAAIYHTIQGTKYVVPAGDLSFSVLVFCVCAGVCFCVLILRRMFVGYELGGENKLVKNLTGYGLISLWLLYVLLSSLKTTGTI